MKAIDVRLNRARFNQRDREILNSSPVVNFSDTRRVIERLSGNGCPYHLNEKWYESSCMMRCIECWNQEPKKV